MLTHFLARFEEDYTLDSILGDLEELMSSKSAFVEWEEIDKLFYEWFSYSLYRPEIVTLNPL